jgi:hypothetical protein
MMVTDGVGDQERASARIESFTPATGILLAATPVRSMARLPPASRPIFSWFPV